MEGSATSFADVLGFEIDVLYGSPPVHGRVKAGDSSYGQPVYIHLSLPGDDEPGRQPTGELRIHVGADIDGLYQAYRQRDANVVREPTAAPWGLCEFVVLGPDGHYLRFCAEG